MKTIPNFLVALCPLFIGHWVFAAPGDLDLSFGSGGKVVTAVWSFADSISEIALQSDGKIVATAGYGYNGTAVLRYHANGTPDTTFNGTGRVDTSGVSSGIAIQGDGKIVVVGSMLYGIGFYYSVVERYNTNGSKDTTFGDFETPPAVGRTGRKEFQYLGNVMSTTGSVAIQSDGKIVVAGSSDNGTVSLQLARFTTDGDFDPDFGNTGVVTTPGGDVAFSLAIQSDRRIVVAGGSANDGAALRYLPDGNLDPSFGGTGKVVVDFGPSSDFAWDVALLESGKILLAGGGGFVEV